MVPAHLKDGGITQEMVSTLRDIVAFRKSVAPGSIDEADRPASSATRLQTPKPKETRYCSR